MVGETTTDDSVKNQGGQWLKLLNCLKLQALIAKLATTVRGFARLCHVVLPCLASLILCKFVLHSTKLKPGAPKMILL